MSVTSGLFGFLPGTRIIMAPFFLLGALLTTNGLVTLTKGGIIVRNEWSWPKVKRAMERAPETATVQILQTWFPEEDFFHCLKHLYRDVGKRFHLRIMLMNPNRQGVTDVLTARLKLRHIERAKAAREINQEIDHLCAFKKEIEETVFRAARSSGYSETVDLEIRLYDFLPFGPIYRIGEEVIFVGLYLNYTSSVAGPMLEIRKNRSPDLWRILEDEFDKGWDVSTAPKCMQVRVA
jgi:hypothetical protein